MSVTLNASTSSGLVQTADTSGTVEIQSNGTTRLTVASTGVTIGGTFGGSVITSGTVNGGAANPLSGATSVDFTSIPSWVKRITIMFDGVSLSGSDSFLIQLGDSGGIETTGYNGGGTRIGATSVNAATFTTGFGFNNTTAATLYSGNIILCNVTGNTWSASGVLGGSATELCNITGGSKTLSATLDRVSITRSGTNTFDAGTINILYEG